MVTYFVRVDNAEDEFDAAEKARAIVTSGENSPAVCELEPEEIKE